jgi:superfamily II DNA/RNA helicase
MRPKINLEPAKHEPAPNQDISLGEDKTFEFAGLNSYLISCYQSLGYRQPTPIQFYALSAYQQQQPHSVIAQSKSGTGKTLSYLSILFSHLLASSAPITHRCSYLIILPTR